MDLDAYVEMYNSKWVWENNEQKEKDQLNARINFCEEISKYLKDDYDVIAIGERLLTAKEVQNFISKITASCTAYVYHLTVSFSTRVRRLHLRGSHSLIDLEKDQKDRDSIKNWPGYVYENIHSPEEDASNLFSLIRQGKGFIS